MFVVFEGADYVGKTTLLKKVSEQLTERFRLPDHNGSVIDLREPGGSGLSEQIRSLVLNSTSINPHTAALMFYAARNELFTQPRVRDFVESPSNLILCDRYFLSSMVYQKELPMCEHIYLIDMLDLPHPDLIVHVRTTTKAFEERRRMREQKDAFDLESAHEFIECQDRYSKAITHYRRAFAHVADVRVLEIDNSSNDADDFAETVKAIVEHIASAKLMRRTA